MSACDVHDHVFTHQAASERHQQHRGGIHVHNDRDHWIFVYVQSLCEMSRAAFRHEWSRLHVSLQEFPLMTPSALVLFNVVWCLLGGVVVVATVALQYLNAAIADAVTGRILVA